MLVMHFNVSFMRVRSRNLTGKRGGMWGEETEIVLRSFFFLSPFSCRGEGGGVRLHLSFVPAIGDRGRRTVKNDPELSKASSLNLE